MIVQLGLLLVTFVGSKVIDSLKEKSRKAQPRPRNAEPQAEADEQAEAEAEAKKAQDKRQVRDLTGSLVSMGLLAGRHFIPGAVPLGVATFLYSAVTYMKNVERSLLRDKKVNVDVLFFVADALTFGTKHYFTAALGLSMIYKGRFMVKKTRDNSAKNLSHLYREMPQTVWKLIDGAELEIPLASVRAGDLLVVTSGSVIPVDGVIVEGIAQIDQQALTGEAQPAERGKNDPVFANTIVLGGKLLIRVDRSGAETTSAQIAAMLLNSVSYKSSVQLKGEKWADQMAKPMLISAFGLLPFIGPVSTAVFINAHIGARILLFAPLTTLRHITEASKFGVLVKDGRALEQLCHVDTVLFDKTGTLTTEQPEVKKVTAFNGSTRLEVLGYAATAERKLTHPIARAILKKAEEEGVIPHEIEDAQYTMGFGVTVLMEGKIVRVGSLRFFQQEGTVISEEVRQRQTEAHLAGNTFILVGVDDRVEGTLELHPQIRPEARGMIEQLRAFGIEHMAIVSGDDRAPTKQLAEELGMDQYFHNVLPENKADIVEALQAKGKVVCFIGDGINDSIALKKANVSMSISGAASIAKDMAEIIFMDGSLKHLPALLELSKRLEINLKRSLVLCLMPSAVALLGAFVFKLSILTTLLINNGFALIGVSGIFYTREKAFPKPRKALPEKTGSPADFQNMLDVSFEETPLLAAPQT